MPYTLTVTNVTGRRPEFAFNTEEAKLGRTADNDIVVKDPNASRKHCRVFVKDGRHWLEDLKSANGTSVNGEVVHGQAVELKDGDTIAIGEVTFAFTVHATPSAEIPKYDFDFGDTVVRGGYGAKATDPKADVIQTSLTPAFDPVEAVRERERATARAPARAPEPPPVSLSTTDELDPASQLIHVNVDATDKLPIATTLIPAQALAAPAPLPQAPAAPDKTMTSEVPAPAGALVKPGRPRDAAGEEDSQIAEPTAAQKARVRRQANKTLAGRLLYAFDQLSRPARVAVATGLIALLAGFGALVVWLAAPPPKRVLPAEPDELQSLGPVIEYSFGRGDGVDYERTDLKTFSFKVASPTRAVGLVHYHARDVGKDEVAISINGQELGFVPPDVVNTADRDVEVVLPAGQINRAGVNQLTFDNVKNPPGKEGWAIWNLSLQLMPLPDLSPEETLGAVKEDLARAQKFFDLREIGPDALFNAWRAYRDAWLKLESMPGRPNDLYAIARGQQTESWKLLDRRCKLMQVDVQRALTKTTPDYDTARIVLNEMLRYFPTREHPCHAVVKGQLQQLDAESP